MAAGDVRFSAISSALHPIPEELLSSCRGELLTLMYGPTAFRKSDFCMVLEVADMYPACLIDTRAVAMMGIRTLPWSH